MADPETESNLVIPQEWVQNCHVCTHAMFGERGTFCPVFSEMIWDEKTAGEDCPEFKSSDGKTYVNLDPPEPS